MLPTIPPAGDFEPSSADCAPRWPLPAANCLESARRISSGWMGGSLFPKAPERAARHPHQPLVANLLSRDGTEMCREQPQPSGWPGLARHCNTSASFGWIYKRPTTEVAAEKLSRVIEREVQPSPMAATSPWPWQPYSRLAHA